MQSPAAVATFRELAGDQFEAQDGQDLLEYALLVGLIALMALGGVTVLGRTITDVFWNAIAAASL
jgi:Flp pilus assembly pilin Flp